LSTLIFNLLLGIPLVTALSCSLLRDRKAIEWLNAVGSFLTLGTAIWLITQVRGGDVLRTARDFFYADGLSAFLILIIAFISFMAAVYSIAYLRHETDEKQLTLGMIRRYYGVFHVFVFTMFLVPLSNNLGFLWIAIEGTTLASAFLVGFYDDEASIEAAWKYLIICSVGIALALFGTILLYFSALHLPGLSGDALQWSYLITVAKKLNPTIVKLAFVFVLVGYGTKAGLAPMHTWLPDAHSQAPSPISALLSGVLLNSALYALLRFNLLTVECVGGSFSGTLMIIFGILSIAASLPFILIQQNYKRLLAYSSIEHVGIITFGFGLGTPLALYGSLLHMLNNALAKALLFFSAGEILQRYRTKMIPKVSGVIMVMPLTGVIFFLGVFTITGWPPFGVFVSEFTILNAGFLSGNFLPSIMFLGLVAITFIGFIYYATGMVFGEPSPSIEHGRGNPVPLIILITLILLLLVLGVMIPPFLNDFLNAAVAVTRR
jgi:hydrogenase-4 component F